MSEDRTVHAVAGGFVLYVGPLPQYGTTVIIAHGGGIETPYSRLDKAEVQPGPVTSIRLSDAIPCPYSG
ncbi:MAG: M23 family metallopeptidase [Proteobacteria bacterium]|nr:M23 family metallopeptidase [Pseudomonadota bacterium]